MCPPPTQPSLPPSFRHFALTTYFARTEIEKALSRPGTLATHANKYTFFLHSPSTQLVLRVKANPSSPQVGGTLITAVLKLQQQTMQLLEDGMSGQ